MKLEVGLVVAPVSFPEVTQAQLRIYADASGDYNPIHLDEEVAKKAGLPGVIAHGMFVAGLVSERALKFLKESELSEYRMESFYTRFKAMTRLGDVPTVGGTIKEVTDRSFVLDLQARNQRGELVVLGSARFAKL